MKRIRISLTPHEMNLLRTALDSHTYWELADSSQRNNGFVHLDDDDDSEEAEEIRECEALEEKLAAAQKAHEDKMAKTNTTPVPA